MELGGSSDTCIGTTEVGVRARFEMIGWKAGRGFAVQEARQLALKRGKVRKARPATR